MNRYYYSVKTIYENGYNNGTTVNGYFDDVLAARQGIRKAVGYYRGMPKTEQPHGTATLLRFYNGLCGNYTPDEITIRY
jgi:hypothetical protein